MSKTIRFGGAQIPCTPYIKKNIITIKKAIDWAAENNVDYLVTPEASLSGYYVNFTKDIIALTSALREIEDYAKEKQIGLCLGTLWTETNQYKEMIRRNQIRYYDKNGRFVGATDKMVLTPLDVDIGIVAGGPQLTGIALSIGNDIIPIGGLVCADLYGHYSKEGGLPSELYGIGVKLLVHSTNADRGTDLLKDEIEDIWLEANIRRVSHQILPIIVADNCYKMTGEPYDGRTSTQSGVCIDGIWVVKVPRFGSHYFYYDFPLDSIVFKAEEYTDPKGT
jgi:predicted amidohydrolase